MHEVGVTEEIVRIIISEAESHGAGKVVSAELSVGALTGFYPDVILYYFDMMKQEHPLIAEAVLEARSVPGKLTCFDCHHVSEITDYLLTCPLCDSLNTDLEGGQDVLVTTLEIEEREYEGDKNSP